MFQIYEWAYQDWHTIDIAGLIKVTDPTGANPFALTTDQFKTITGEDYNTAIASNK